MNIQSSLLFGILAIVIQLSPVAADELDDRISDAYMRYRGYKKPFDHEFIYTTFQEGVQQNRPKAYAGLGFCYCYGVNVKIDTKKGFDYFKKSADLNDPYGTYYLGICYKGGWSVPKNAEKGTLYIKKANKMGSLYAEVELLKMQLPSMVTKPPNKKLQQVIARLEAIADDKNFPYAAYSVGYYHAGGSTPHYFQTVSGKRKKIPTHKDPEKASKYLRMAAELHLPGAMNKLGSMALGGRLRGGEKGEGRFIEAAKWYRKSAARNNDHGRIQLAMLLKRNLEAREEGENWYAYILEAHERGYIYAASYLADINYHAPGYSFRDLDWSLSAYYYDLYLKQLEEAGKSSYYSGLDCMYKQCEMYYEGGHGLKRDYIKCLEAASEYIGREGISTAYAGRVLLHPDAPLGKSRDHYIRGYACMIKARSKGYEISDDGMYLLRSRYNLTVAEVAESKKLAAEGYPHSYESLLP